ncbi:hypothetical protein AVEN_48148-1 [Araneus ventricosus]|uniref:Uncharacterized protein n=1 Tax=Araneus ventricosus TaxID=182803 RepID=A0A4Y2FAV5_ARAVE|nr:hypothetical protein AVEN_48148-1 [Araneus ventricosus]
MYVRESLGIPEIKLNKFHVVRTVSDLRIKPAIHFADKLDILEREKERPSKSMEIRRMACGGWNSVRTEIGTKNQRDPERG